MNIEFSNEIKAAAKNLQVLLVEADVNNALHPMVCGMKFLKRKNL